MAGHSHSANIKHRKDAMDKKRAKVFSKIAKKLIVAARQGGGDIQTNVTLRYAYELARAANMPKDVIQRNIDKGAGTGPDAVSFEELLYEGYGPGGIAIMCDVLTDNRNRTAPEMKKIFEKGGGNLGEPGCVNYMFETKAVFLVNPGDKSEDDIMELVMEVEADDMEADGDAFLITAPPTNFVATKEALESAGLEMDVSEISRIPSTTIEVTDEAQAEKLMKLIGAIDDHDDVQNVYSNYEMSDELMAKVTEG